MKKKCIIALTIIAVILFSVVISIIAVNKKKEKTDQDYEYTVHESDKDTIEEETEDGLNISDSEDGPVLDEDNMIDFNGGDSNSGNKTDEKDGKTDVTPNTGGETEVPSEGDLENPEEPEEPDVPDTGTWGGSY